jgi:leucyl/phenylalanyl-tRNA--protein transferase
MIPQLGADPSAPFPDPNEAMHSPDGLLAWGGDLDPVRLSNAYHHGIFPWFSDQQPILWWSPSTRCVLFPAELYISSRLKRVLRQQRFRVSADQAFDEVITGCALPRVSQDSTWITTSMIDAYNRLHRMGIGHSIEVWSGEDLVGGLYGLSIGRVFFGESMFSLVSDASKIAMVHLCRQLDLWGFTLLDCQVSNPHLKRMGAVDIPRESFLSILRASVNHAAPRASFAQTFGSKSG